MSQTVFPSLPGMTYDRVRRPLFNTNVSRSASGREVRTAYQLYPLWEFEVTFDLLRSQSSYSEYQQLLGFVLMMLGQYDSFLYTDPTDNAVTAQQFGTGDGTTTTFQLTRSIGYGSYLFVEPVDNVNAITSITETVSGTNTTIVQGTGAGKYTLGSTGIITFGTAPISGTVLQWTGSFYYRCRMEQDNPEFNEFMYNLQEMKKLKFVGATGNRV